LVTGGRDELTGITANREVEVGRLEACGRCLRNRRGGGEDHTQGGKRRGSKKNLLHSLFS